MLSTRCRLRKHFLRRSAPGRLRADALCAPRILDLPEDVLQLICFYTIRQHSLQTWITPADLAGHPARSWCRVSRTFYNVFHACISRFSFFLVSPHAPNQRAAATHAHILKTTLLRCSNLRELQLFIRPRDIYVTDAVGLFFARSLAPLSTVHLCCAPPPVGESPREPLAVVTDVIRAIALSGQRLDALSLDCCNTLSHTAARILAEAVGPNLTRFAMDFTFFQDWTALAKFRNLVELRLQNTSLSDTALRRILSSISFLEILAIHQVPGVTKLGLEPLASSCSLKILELSRCIGIDNDAVSALSQINSLTTIRLVHIDVSAVTLENLVRQMGSRLISLSVNAISSAHDDVPASCLETLLHTVKAHCTNVRTLDFGSSSISRESHWSVRPYYEALRHTATTLEPPRCSNVRPLSFRLRMLHRENQRFLTCFS